MLMERRIPIYPELINKELYESSLVMGRSINKKHCVLHSLAFTSLCFSNSRPLSILKMIVIKRLENPTGMMPPGSEHRANADVLVILDEQIKEVADLCVRAYAKGELSYCRNVNFGQ